MNFEKYYLLDTNILLEDARNIFKLSDDAKNLIILSETVLDEIDSKKSGYDEINFQAREFVLRRMHLATQMHKHLAS